MKITYTVTFWVMIRLAHLSSSIKSKLDRSWNPHSQLRLQYQVDVLLLSYCVEYPSKIPKKETWVTPVLLSNINKCDYQLSIINSVVPPLPRLNSGLWRQPVSSSLSWSRDISITDLLTWGTSRRLRSLRATAPWSHDRAYGPRVCLHYSKWMASMAISLVPNLICLLQPGLLRRTCS